MSESNFNFIQKENSAPIKAWTKGVPVEEQALNQAINTSKLPFIFKHIALMPDVHLGIGATVGSVIPTKGAIIPAAVGVDIGCGMAAVMTNLKAEHLPDNLSGIRSAIEAAVPHGRTNNGKPGDRGSWGNAPEAIQAKFSAAEPSLKEILERHPKIVRHGTAEQRSLNQLGTLGTGNHFIEVCLDESDCVWIMLHSGSRGIGNAIGSYFINLAKEDMRKWFINLPDGDLAYFPEGTEHFRDYVAAVSWAQSYAQLNRDIMMELTANAIAKELDINFNATTFAVNCHHNYVEKEHHFGENIWVTRKGAVRARQGDMGIIPGSMGARSYIVKGKGNPESFFSCSHGAGRAMSRGEAKRRFTVLDHYKATLGVECRKDESVIDETPMAYKSIDDVMAAQSDLVEVFAVLKQIVCVKG